MANRTLALVALGLVVGWAAPQAVACWDNTDLFVVKLKKLNLSTEQLKDVFVYQKQHKAVVDRAHREKLGCRYHENHEAVFQKQAIGVLTDAQFKKHTGRVRTKVESLEYENRLLKKKIAKMEKRIKALEKQLQQQIEAKKRAAEQAKKQK
jgi:predicted RNase H-like nuclease (RuvC/YqgF family)